MSKTKTKQYSPAYWTKQALRYASQPEAIIAAAVETFAKDPEACPVAFQGTTHELLETLYLEWRKSLKSVHLALFPTPMPVARKLVELLGIGIHDHVFDPGAGLGNLLVAARERGAFTVGIEYQYWIPPLDAVLHLGIERGDFIDGTAPVPNFNIVVTNPPFGRIGQSADATTDFMERIADVCTPGTMVGAILPNGHFDRGPKRRLAVADRFRTDHREALPDRTFAPLTSVSTELHILSIR